MMRRVCGLGWRVEEGCVAVSGIADGVCAGYVVKIKIPLSPRMSE
jgi:hypothetical protein